MEIKFTCNLPCSPRGDADRLNECQHALEEENEEEGHKVEGAVGPA